MTAPSRFPHVFSKKTLASAVALFVIFAAFAAIIIPSSDAAQDETYNLDMFVGDSFSYTPSTNLSGATFSVTGNGLESNGGWLTWNASTKTLSGTATAQDFRTVVITANWSSGSLTQTASQTINFSVYNHTVITSTTYNSGAVVGEAYSYDLTFTGQGAETVSLTGMPSWLTWNGTIEKLTGTPAAGDAGSTADVVITVSNATTGDSDSITLHLIIYADLAFLSTAPSAVINGTLYTYTVSISSVPDAVVNKTSGPSWILWNGTTKVLSGTPDLTISGEYTDVTVVLTASSDILGRNVTQNITIRVWDKMDWVSDPTSGISVAIQGLSVQFTFTGDNATFVSWDLGDGTVFESLPSDEVTHEYQSAGMYVARATAFNENGSDAAVMLLDLLSEDDDAATGSFVDSVKGSLMDYSALIVLIIVIIGSLALLMAMSAKPLWAVILIGSVIMLAICLWTGSYSITDLGASVTTFWEGLF